MSLMKSIALLLSTSMLIIRTFRHFLHLNYTQTLAHSENIIECLSDIHGRKEASLICYPEYQAGDTHCLVPTGNQPVLVSINFEKVLCCAKIRGKNSLILSILRVDLCGEQTTVKTD